MVSDIVILKELPEFIRESIDAYIGCVAGALNKDEYLRDIKAAGFKEVKVLDETTYPLDLFIDDEAAKLIIADMKLTAKQVNDISASIASVKVQGWKAG